MNQPIKWSRLDLLQQMLIIGAAAAVLFLCAPYFGAFLRSSSPKRWTPAREAAAGMQNQVLKNRATLPERARPTPAAAKNLAEIEELLR